MNKIGFHSHDSQPAGDRNIFWGELTPCEHVVQIYEADSAFLDALHGFILGGLIAGESTIVIATPEHRAALVDRLVRSGIDVEAARDEDRYIDVDAAETLEKFMTTMSGLPWPNEDRFHRVVNQLLQRAQGHGPQPRRVRAFGEMVALLWADGGVGATLRLEMLWHAFCQHKAFCLFCAYPKVGFTDPAEKALKEIIAAHSRVYAA